MTRNDAYKTARRVWRRYFRRKPGHVSFGHVWSITEFMLRVDGNSERDIKMIRLWTKAFEAGRRYPDESDMRRIETMPV